MQQSRASLRWRWGIFAALLVTLLTMLPQLNQWRLRGRDWHGSFYTYHPDESPYAAYLNSLIEGRTRRNDPYSGLQDARDAPLAESLFSIQFVPPYALATFARLFGFSASTVFIILAPLSAFATSLIIFRLVGKVTRDERVAATAVFVVLLLGGLARGQFLVRLLGGLDTRYIPFLFLRRYEPAFPFPFFFLMCALVWSALRAKTGRAALLYASGAGLTFALLVFSYFHLWTAAAAWLACLAALLLIARPEGNARDLKSFSLLAALALLALTFYAYLLSHRAQDVDNLTVLTFSHAPDLLRPPELLGLFAVALLALFARRGIIMWREREVIFAASFGLMPLIVFNQQVLTGRSLQPIHYEQFIANHVALLAIVLAVALISREHVWFANRPTAMKMALASIALLCLVRGVIEVRFVNRQQEFNVKADQGWRIAQRFAELAHSTTSENDFNIRGVVAYTLPVKQESIHSFLPDTLPAVAPQPVLWAVHMLAFSEITPAENRERYYQNLYYSGIEPQQIESSENLKKYFMFVIYGWDRAIPGLSANRRPVSPEEERQAIHDYANYVSSFDRTRATHPTLAYIATPVSDAANFSNLDRWYERDAGERVDTYMLYRVKLRPLIE